MALKPGQKYFDEYFVYNATFNPLAASTSGTVFTSNEIRIDPDSHFKLSRLSHVATSPNYNLQIRDDTDGRFYQKGAYNARAAVGQTLSGITANGFLPFNWMYPQLIAPAGTIDVQAADASGSSNTIRLALHGAKVREGIAPWKKRKFVRAQNFFYPLSASDTGGAGTVSLSANQSTSISIPTDRETPFQVLAIVGTRTGAALINIKDSARDAQWMNSDSHFDNIVGNSQYPNRLPAPRFVHKGSVVSISLTDLSGSTNNIQLYLVGVKLYEG